MTHNPKMTAPAEVVTLAYEDLLGAPSAATQSAISRGFGPSGLGLVLVTGVPGYPALRAAALPHAHAFATQPAPVLSRYEHAPSSYSFGWSRGRESFGGVLDVAKGSFYFNPLHDAPCAGSPAAADPALAPFYHPNVWPAPGDAAPGFEAALKALGAAMVAVGGVLSAHVDAFVAARLRELGRPPPPAARTLQAVVTGSRTPKARLLYYFPAGADASAEGGGGGGPPEGAWCGAHNDHGSLTALTSALFFDDASGAVVPCPDPAAGLYIFSRAGVPVKVAIPPDALAFQIGETAQVASGGALRATPHFVRAPAAAGVSRGTLAVFMEPEHGDSVDVPEGADVGAVLEGDASLPRGVPPLGQRWAPGDTFAAFTKKTLAAYY